MTTSQTNTLTWEIFPSPPVPVATDPPPDGLDRRWTPAEWWNIACSATLIAGKHDAVLVDPLLTIAQGRALADWIYSSGKHLTTVYVTHGHGDHWFGLDVIRSRFPSVRAVATQRVVESMRQQVAPEFFERFWDAQFPGLLASGVAVAEPLESNTFELEGHQLVAAEVGDSDTYDTTVLHVPDLGLVVAGDVAYNDIHPFLVESTHARRLGWIAALDKIESLKPRAVIAGHKRQGRADNPTIIEETRQYLRDFDRVVDATTTPRELYEQMLELYPDRLNPGVLWSSAQALKSDASPLWSAVRSLDG